MKQNKLLVLSSKLNLMVDYQIIIQIASRAGLLNEKLLLQFLITAPSDHCYPVVTTGKTMCTK